MKKGENLQDQAHSRYLRNSCWKNKWRNTRGPLWGRPAEKACRQQFSPFVQKILGLLAPGWRFIPSQEPLAFPPPCLWQLFNSAGAYFCYPSFLQLMGSMSCTVEFIPPHGLGLGRNTRGGQDGFQEEVHHTNEGHTREHRGLFQTEREQTLFCYKKPYGIKWLFKYMHE